MTANGGSGRPRLLQTVLDCPHPRDLAEFYRELLGFAYRPGDERPPDGVPDDRGDDWLVLVDPNGSARLAFQAERSYVPPRWPPVGDEPPSMMVHLDLLADSPDELRAARDRALALGADLRLDRTDDPEEPLYVFADPAGHPFCIFC